MIGIRLPLVAAALLSSTVPALAAPDASTARVSIGYDLSELTSAPGRKSVLARIDTAIARMCGAPVLFNRDEAEALETCRAEARAAVMPQYEAALGRARSQIATR